MIYKFHDIYEGLIGNDILVKFNALIDYGKRTINLNGVEIKLHFKTDKQNTVYQIDPGEHYYHIPVTQESGITLVEGTKVNKSITLHEGVCEVNNFKALARISNEASEPIIINFDKPFASVEIQEVQDFYNFQPSTENSGDTGEENLLEQIRKDHLSCEEKSELGKAIKQYRDIFNNEKLLSFTSEIKHKINTVDNTPVKSKIYRYPYVHKLEIQKQIQDMLERAELLGRVVVLTTAQFGSSRKN